MNYFYGVIAHADIRFVGEKSCLLNSFYISVWSGGAMALGKLPVSGRPTIRIIVGQEPAALAIGAGGGLFGHILSLLCLPLFGRRPNID